MLDDQPTLPPTNEWKKGTLIIRPLSSVACGVCFHVMSWMLLVVGLVDVLVLTYLRWICICVVKAN